PEADRERIFEPFYTTKGSDHFGLGLSVARDAARLHKGDLVYNEERGFVMRLPFDNGLPL
ncbi:MAG: sensor histidine kinase, partial [Nitrospiraceae bacterium]|nr:sensor histidine kinase [Nitrospiraceae bacterium]